MRLLSSKIVPAGLDLVHELIERRAIHGDEHVRIRHKRRADGFIGETNAAIRGAAAHLRAVGRQPRELPALDEACIRHNFTGEQNALTAETGKNDVQVFHFSLSPFVPSLYTPSG